MTTDEIVSSRITPDGFREDYYKRCEDNGTILQYYTLRNPATPEEVAAAYPKKEKEE